MQNTQIPHGSWYTFATNEDGTKTITGFDPNKNIDIGSYVFLGKETPIKYEVSEISRRNHAGTFLDEERKIDSHYTAILKISQ